MASVRTATELMKNQKAAQVIADQSALAVVQTADGQALFFSISDTNQLYLTIEQQQVSTGWVQFELTSELGVVLGGQQPLARHFSVSQNPVSGSIVIAQVVHTAEDNQDHLFILPGLPNTPAANWMQPNGSRPWLARPYDAATPPAALNLAYANLTANQDTQNAPYLVAGVIDPQTAYISNYLVSLDPAVTSAAWQAYVTAENYDTLLAMQLGMPQSAMAVGLYELYTLNGETSLTFTPSAFPVVTKLAIPSGASAIATLPVDSDGDTNLYVAADGAIYLFPANQQTRSATPLAIMSSALVTGVDQLEVHLYGEQVTLWGRNAQGTVFYSRCVAGQQTDATAWSTPIPIAQNANQVAALLNPQTQMSTLFVHSQGAALTKLSQDPVTTAWSAQPVLLPNATVDSVTEYYSFTTHIDLIDDDQLPQTAGSLMLSASSAVALYINNNYTLLVAGLPLTVQPTATGAVTIIQPTETLGAASYTITTTGLSPVMINPMTNLLSTLSKVQHGSDLDVQVSDENDNITPLVPANVTPGQQDAVAQAVQQLVLVGQALPADGSVAPGASGQTAALALAGDAIATWGLSFANGDVQFFESAGNVSNPIEALAGDVLHWLTHVAAEVREFVVHVVDGVAHFFVTIGGEVYHFVLACLRDVLHSLQFVFQQIGIAFEKLVQWLGFIFNWNDIKRTHQVLKSIFSTYLTYAVASLDTCKQDLIDASQDLQNAINNWAGLPQPSGSLSSASLSASSVPGQSHPAAHWAAHHLGSNVGVASTLWAAPDPDVSALTQVFDAVAGAIKNEGKDLAYAFTTIKQQVIDQIKTLPVGEIIQKLFAVMGDLVVESLTNLVVPVFEILKVVVSGMVDAFTATIDMPVLSWFYHTVFGGELSFMDVCCMLVAIPTTVIYKIAEGVAPFPDDATSTALIAAPDFATIQQILAAPASTPIIMQRTAQKAADNWVFFMNLVATVSSVGVAIFTAAKAESENSPVPSIGYAVCYLPYCAPDFGIAQPQTWDQRMNLGITIFSICKSGVDISLYKFQKGEGATNGVFISLWQPVSPWVEAVTSFIWMVPAVWPLSRSTSAKAWITAAANISFNSTGIIGIFDTLDEEQISKGALTVAMVMTVLLYGTGLLIADFVSD